MTQFTPTKMSIAACAALLISSAPAFAGGLSNEVVEPEPMAPMAAAPQASGDYYVSVFAGANALSDADTSYNYSGYSIDVSPSFDTGFVAGVTFGKKISDTLRVEGELSFAHNDADSVDLGLSYSGYSYATGSYAAEGDLDATYLLVNLWYDIPTTGPLGYYVGGGIGAAKVEGDGTITGSTFGVQVDETKMAIQIGAGVMYDISQSLTLDVGYRFKYVGDVDMEETSGSGFVFEGGDIQSHSLQAGLMYSF
jgi:opacity protein-like surface antigen